MRQRGNLGKTVQFAAPRVEVISPSNVFTHLEEFCGALLDVLGADDLLGRRGVPVREARLEVRQPRHARPHLLVGRAEGAEDAEELVDLRVSREERALVELKQRGIETCLSTHVLHSSNKRTHEFSSHN